MSLPSCPIQDVCPNYTNGDPKANSHYYRTHRICTKFITMECEMGTTLEVFITGQPIACSVEKGRTYRILNGSTEESVEKLETEKSRKS